MGFSEAGTCVVRLFGVLGVLLQVGTAEVPQLPMIEGNTTATTTTTLTVRYSHLDGALFTP